MTPSNIVPYCSVRESMEREHGRESMAERAWGIGIAWERAWDRESMGESMEESDNMEERAWKREHGG